MPIYEFRCEACGTGFEALVGAGTEAVDCIECRAASARRVYSPPAPPHRVARTPREVRKQERANARLRESAKARFRKARERARSQAPGGPDGER